MGDWAWAADKLLVPGELVIRIGGGEALCAKADPVIEVPFVWLKQICDHQGIDPTPLICEPGVNLKSAHISRVVLKFDNRTVTYNIDRELTPGGNCMLRWPD